MFPLDCAISLLLPALRKKFGSRAGGCAVFQRFAQEAAHEKAGWMGRCIGAGLAVPAGRGFPLLPAGGADERTGHGGRMPRGGGGARPALCRRIRADAAAAGGVVAGAPPAADGRSPRGKNRGLRAGVRRLAGGERVRRGARVGLRAGRAGSQRFRAAMETTQRRRCPRPLERSAPWRPAARRTDSAAQRGPACSTRCGRKAGSSRYVLPWRGSTPPRCARTRRSKRCKSSPFWRRKARKAGGKTCQQRKNCV